MNQASDVFGNCDATSGNPSPVEGNSHGRFIYGARLLERQTRLDVQN
jgi:hypothetical protein